MTSIAQYNVENAELGELLLKVQDELRTLRKKITTDQDNVDLKSLQKALEKAENGIKTKTDKFISHLNNQVSILPMFDDDDELQTSANFAVPVSSVIDYTNQEILKRKKLLNRPEENQYEISRELVPSQSTTRIYSATKKNSNSNLRALVLYNQQNDNDSGNYDDIYKMRQTPTSMPKSVTIEDLSPGQKTRLQHESKAILNPLNVHNRFALHDNYCIQLPLIEQKKAKKNSSRIITGSTIDPLKVLPTVNRKLPGFIPVSIDEVDTKHGLLSLLERGLIPQTAKITFEPPAFAPKKAEVHEISKFTDKKRPDSKILREKQDLAYKLDPNYKPKPEPSKEIAIIDENVGPKLSREGTIVSKHSSNANFSGNTSSMSKLLASGRNMQPPGSPKSAIYDNIDAFKKSLRFAIQNGATRSEMPDFINFKQHFLLDWGNIVSVIRKIEEYCRNYVLSIAFVDGGKVADLAKNVTLGLKLSDENILDTFLNREDIEKIVKSPGRRFLGPDGQTIAAIKIQSYWRRYRDRRVYLEYRRRKWAAGVIAFSWFTYIKMLKIRRDLKKKRQKNLENSRRRMQDLAKAWPKLIKSKRTVIHIPSLGYNKNVRDTMHDLTVRENYQMNRLCDIMDENVDVIYVSPVPITDETLQYYFKLLGLRTAVDTGNPDDQSDLSRRYKIIIPEALNSFPTHNFSLSTLLKYSPKALKRITNLIRGRDAYIVPGVMNKDDLDIAELLNVPILATEPEVSYLFSTKSGSKRIFQYADVTIPYGESDIYNKQQLHECLVQEIIDNLDVQRWIFKFDDEYDGRGTAYCDVAKHLPSYMWAVKEAARYGTKWSKKWAQETTFSRILAEISDMLANHAVIVNKKAYSTWDAYEMAFLKQGGVLEAYPPSDSVTSLTVNILIEPDQTVKILASGDHIHADSVFSCWGLSFPQSSVDATELNDACLRIANVCIQKNIVGYVDIDFVTYIDAKTQNQVLWATDMNIFYSDHMGMYQMLLYMTNGTFNSTTHQFEVETPKDFGTNRRPRPSTIKDKIQEYNRSRYAVMSSKLYHTNLSLIHYSVFFQTCRAYGIGYDVKEKQGTLFTLVDSINHKHMGMMTIGENLQATLQQFALNLGAIHREISTDNMQGITNFLLAIEDIGNILGVTKENMLKQ